MPPCLFIFSHFITAISVSVISDRSCHNTILYGDAMPTIRHLGYEMVYLPLDKVADTPFNFQGDVIQSRG